MTNGHYVIPKLVEDASLKRARTTITEGGEEKEAIRVTPAGGNGNLDSQGVADAMGMSASNMTSTSVLGYLANNTQANVAINTYLSDISSTVGSQADSTWAGSGDGTLNAIAKRTSNDTNTVAYVLGTDSDIKIDSSQDGTISSRIRQISSNTEHIFSDVGQLLAATGSRSDSAWSGTGSGSLVAVEKRNALATGTKSDAAWSGSGDGTVIALLKGIYNKL